MKNNENNIELIINWKKSNLIREYELNKEENTNITIIKNKITDLEYMLLGRNKL